jgi:DNA repair protein RadC
MIFDTRREARTKAEAWRDDDELSFDDQPCNRIDSDLARGMSNSEILSLLIRNPQSLAAAQEILAATKSIHELSELTIFEIATADGVSQEDARAIKAAFELGRRLSLPSGQEQIKITCAEDAANILMAEIGHLKRETLVTIQMDTQLNMIGMNTIYRGAINTIGLRLVEVIKPAVIQDAAAVIISHNHPGGSPQPSRADIETTMDMVNLCKTMSIQFMDHVIVSSGGWYSLKENGRLEDRR